MNKFVLAFIFDQTFEHVLLMHKNRPEWQKGKINGLGGKVEEGESALNCVHREVKEESGLQIEAGDWVKCGVMYSDSFTMDVFGCAYKGNPSDAQTLEDEPIEWFSVNSLPKNTINNLQWLMNITLDKVKNEDIEDFEVKYKL